MTKRKKHDPFAPGTPGRKCEVCGRGGGVVAVTTTDGQRWIHQRCRKLVDAVRLPVAFYDDHEERELDTPQPLKRTQRYVWVSRKDPALNELLHDAQFYADPYGPSEPPGIKQQARACAKAIRAALDESVDEDVTKAMGGIFSVPQKRRKR